LLHKLIEPDHSEKSEKGGGGKRENAYFNTRKGSRIKQR